MKETDCLFVAYAGQQRLLTDLQTFSEKKIEQPQPIFNAQLHTCVPIFIKKALLSSIYPLLNMKKKSFAINYRGISW